MKFLISSLLFLMFLFGCASDRLCPRNVPVRISRRVFRNSARIETYRNWYGSVKTQWRPYTFSEIEYFTINQVQYDCCFGFHKVGGICEPICPTCPENSFCSEPFSCKCKDEFSSSSNDDGVLVCIPICLKACPEFSNCTSPNSCTCYEGYSFNWNTEACSPICADGCPKNAFCDEPGTCKCTKGYEMTAHNDGTKFCQPLCESGCPIHSHCTSPNECRCNDGYQTVKGFCEPKCEPECTAHSVCYAPNNCVCKSGYEFSITEQKCIPVCSVGCPAYSNCVDADICACEEGYLMNENATQCNPVCTTPCQKHSVCYRPNECLCDEGYRLKELPDLNKTQECEPICPDNCLPYGKCVPTLGCVCYPGYALQTDNVDPKATLCQAVCSKECENGFCFSPDFCVCNQGYLMGPNNTCKPTCSMGCINGECVAPDVCACANEYRLMEGSVNECAAICEPACINGDCIAPNFCLCEHDYEMSANFSLTNECVPTCNPGCKNGECIAPNNCHCYEGYEANINNKSECLPTCKSCEFGECVAPEICQCWPGYIEYTENIGEKCISMEMSTDLLTTSTDLIDYSFSSTTNGVELLNELPGAQCSSLCKCWQPAKEPQSLTARKCENVCVDNADEPCLDLGYCACNLNNLKLSCFMEQDNYEENNTTEYKCLVPVESNRSKKSKIVNPPRQTTFPWLIVLGSILGAVLILIVVTVVWRMYVVKRKEGKYTIGYKITES